MPHVSEEDREVRPCDLPYSKLTNSSDNTMSGGSGMTDGDEPGMYSLALTTIQLIMNL